MKKIVITLILTMIISFIGALFLFEYLQNRGNEEAIYSKIYSDILNEKRRVIVHLSRSYDHTTSKKYPVMYVLDGTSQDDHTAYKSDVLSAAGITPEFITVGIPNTNGNRSRDLTPPTMKIDLDDPNSKMGNGNKLLAFIEKELMLYMNANYRTNGYTMFSGNSRGGLLVMYSLLEKPTLFDAHFSYSPAFWRENQKIIAQAKTVFSKKRHIRFFFVFVNWF